MTIKKPRPRRRSPPATASKKLPDCPPHLDDGARAEWERIVPQLRDKGLLDRTDRAAIAGYCQCYARWAAAETKLAELGPVVKSPSGFPIQNPYLSIAVKALDQMARFLREFGMTPHARKRLDNALRQAAKKSPAPSEDPPADHPLTTLKIIRA
jgi:P27 family predicted phage terminase small subunit